MIIIIAAVAALLAAIYYVMNFFENYGKEETAGEGFVSTMPDIAYDGVTYKYKSRLKNILIIGSDSTGDITEHESEGYTGGRCDSIILLSIDYNNRRITPIQFNRDTMANVEMFDTEGNSLGKSSMQLEFAFGYGDGGKTSCSNTVNAVSELLYGIPIDDYYSMNIDAISVINDAVGGVTVTVEDDFSDVDASLVQGDTITLMGEQATHYVRTRKGVGEQTNIERMARQRMYITAFVEAFKAKLAENSSFLSELDGEISPYRYTSMSESRIAALMRNTEGFEVCEFAVPEGTSEVVNELMEYTLDDDALRQLIINTFYEPKDI